MYGNITLRFITANSVCGWIVGGDSMDHYYHHHRHPPQVDGLSNNHTTLDQSNRTRGVKYKHLTGFQLNRQAQNTRASTEQR